MVHDDIHAHVNALVLDWTGLFSSSSAAGTNGCLDLKVAAAIHIMKTAVFHTRGAMSSERGALEPHGFLAAKLNWLNAC